MVEITGLEDAKNHHVMDANHETDTIDLSISESGRKSGPGKP